MIAHSQMEVRRIAQILQSDQKSFNAHIIHNFPEVWNKHIIPIGEKITYEIDRLLDFLKFNMSGQDPDAATVLYNIIETIDKEYQVLYEVIITKIVDRKVSTAPIIEYASRQNIVVDLKNYYDKSHAVIIGISKYKEVYLCNYSVTCSPTIYSMT